MLVSLLLTSDLSPRGPKHIRWSCWFWRAEASLAGVCGSPIPRIADSTSGQVTCIQQCLVHHVVLRMQGCHRRPVSVFGEILSPLPSVCRMQSASQWSSRCLASSFQPFSVPVERWTTHSIFDLLVASCGLELCNPQIGATHISGAGLDGISISSGHAVDVVVHDGLQCCTRSPVCCSVLGWDHFWCITAGLSQPTRQHQRCRLCAIGGTLVLAHAELHQWSA